MGSGHRTTLPSYRIRNAHVTFSIHGPSLYIDTIGRDIEFRWKRNHLPFCRQRDFPSTYYSLFLFYSPSHVLQNIGDARVRCASFAYTLYKVRWRQISSSSKRI